MGVSGPGGLSPYNPSINSAQPKPEPKANKSTLSYMRGRIASEVSVLTALIPSFSDMVTRTVDTCRSLFQELTHAPYQSRADESSKKAFRAQVKQHPHRINLLY